MQIGRILRYPLWALEVLGPTKSFARNPILGSPRLNRMGLHVWRLSTAHRMAAMRRARLGSRIDPDQRRAFDRDGFFVIHDFLPADAWRRLSEETSALRLPAREIREGQTVTRQLLLTPRTLARLPQTRAVVGGRGINDLVRYAGATASAPVWFYQTVIADPARSEADPQTELHSDTFFPTSKAWLFLHDVGEEDGPFAYVPGSHRLTPRRRAWEHRASIDAADDPRSNHRGGSLRLGAEDLEEMGLPAPVRMCVPANTLIVADTHGFHGRSPSPRPTVRVELHGHLRTNPFLPTALLDAKSWPFIRDRQLDIDAGMHEFAVRRLGARRKWHWTGPVALDAPASV
ncbi:phytanoyl-CoA dioxygenase family protein [Limibaculum sp. FT325]|uniref:phytanoyl-CoA dioxygenase family protein n=1 Tax=Thermohalobaculum sediminis TaxID=2939436 RepID=UPI0020C16764|nr:phytanoyl-CoA dioxygenase family protein [Limibaculum sediminis]MCL5777648.1 phytanoyl-CoA dioxygenase family protein [Limibaculum sediminis]